MSQFVILLAPCSMLLELSLELASSNTISSSKITFQQEIQCHEAKQIKQLFCNKLLSQFHISLTFWEVVHLAPNLEICGSSKLSQQYLGCQLYSYARAAIRKQYRLGQHKQLKFASLQFWRLNPAMLAGLVSSEASFLVLQMTLKEKQNIIYFV